MRRVAHLNTASGHRVRNLDMRMVVSITAIAIANGLLIQPAVAAETRGYVINWFATATHSTANKENCPEDRNGGQAEFQIRNLMAVGFTKEEATAKVFAKGGQEVALEDKALSERIRMRGRSKGKPASIYNYPDTVEDPNLETVTGKYAYGFDLGGKPENKFIDIDTGRKIDNQLWRAVGCTFSFNAVPPARPYPEDLGWEAMLNSSPAWLIRVSGEDLNRNGKVTVILDRATRHPRRDALSNVMSGATYVIEPDSRSHNVLQGEIRDGVLTVFPGDIYLEAELPFYTEISLRKGQMRLKLERDGRLVGYMGGIQDWRRWVYSFTARPNNNADTIGIFHALRKMADFDPDPVTGENRAISATYRMEAVPAYLVEENGAVVANAVTTLGPASSVAPGGQPRSESIASLKTDD